MKYTKIITTLSIFSLVPIWANANIQLHEKWSDGERHTQDLASGSLAWYSSAFAGSLQAKEGSLTQQGAARHTIAYFTENDKGISLKNGEKISIEFSIRFSGESPGIGFFRMAVLDSQGRRITSDNHQTSNGAFSGYRGYAFIGDVDGSNSSIRARKGNENNLITTLAPFSILRNTTRNFAEIVPKRLYTGVLVAKRNGDRMELEFSMEGYGSISRTDRSPDTFSFDTIAFAISTGAADGFTLTSVKVSGPSPSDR